MNPGSPEFRRALLSALAEESCRRSSGQAAILAEEWVSRNTVLYRCRMGGERLVAKAQATKPASVAKAEFRMLKDMTRRLGNGRVRPLRPVALFPDLGVIVTEEEDGSPLRSLIERACRGSSGDWVRAARAVQAAANALWAFHEAYSGGSTSRARAGLVRYYMDFSSKNILIKLGSQDSDIQEVVLMDPPEEERWEARTEDIGVFCFDLARIRFLPRFIWRPGVSRRLDWFKAWFIHTYYELVGDQPEEPILRRIEQAEVRRATQTLRWYMTPWRYASILMETARLCYLGPLTAAYRFGGIFRSHSNVRRLLGSGAGVWETPCQ